MKKINSIIARFLKRVFSVFGYDVTKNSQKREEDNFIDDKHSSAFVLKSFDFMKIPGMIDLNSGIYLYLLAYATNLKGDVIEIGSWQGRSTCFLALACKDSSNGLVHSIDSFLGNPGKEDLYKVGKKDLSDLEGNFVRNIKDQELSDFVNMYAMSSEEALSKMENVRARLIFIDGNHDYSFVKKDINNFSSRLLSGGIIVLDDYRPYFSGLVNAVKEEVVNSGEFYNFIQTSSFFIAKKK